MSLLKSFLLTVLLIHVNATPIKPRATPEEYRLPDTVVPKTYKLSLTLNDDVFQTNVFSGILDFTFTVKEALSEFPLHGNKLTITEGNLNTVGNETSPSRNIPLENNGVFEIVEETELFLVRSSEPLTPDLEYTLHFEYTAELRENDMYGLYKSSYLDASNNEKFLATTQFQGTYARRVFPCLDEPIFKAVFEIDITHPTQYTAVGNTVVLSREDNQEATATTTTFTPTPKMSTYLIAFIVSDFTPTAGDNLNGDLPYQIWSREEAAATRAFAVEVGPQLLGKLEEFTNIPFSDSTIGKMDQFAIPDFAAGAMENWGLITYRETNLLWDPLESSNRYKQRVATVIAHEFTHMWFGNLITTHWWSDTFLNEGFATYFETFTTAEVLPTWELDKQFVLQDVQAVLQDDASPSSTALSSPAFTPAEVSGRFNSISYSKGGSVIRMVEHFMGYENFRNGLRTYLDNNRFGNTEPKDLWDALNPNANNLPAGKTLHEVMENWITKPGYPLLNVTVDGTNIIITQKRFLTSGEPQADETWYVPISYTKSTDTNKFQDTSTKAWLLPTEPLVIENALEGADWIILNNQQTGFYRIDYDDNLWASISLALNKEQFDGIDVLNRAQIIDDLFSSAKIGLHPYRKVFELSSFLKNDVSYYPWYSAFTAYSHMWQRTGNAAIRAELSTYIRTQMQKLYDSVPFDQNDDENQIYTLTKVLALNWACILGNQDCIDNSVAAFDAYRTSNTKPNKNLRTTVYCTALRNSVNSARDWTFLWDKFVASKIADEQVTILSALGCTKDTTILRDYLVRSITEGSGIRRQDALSVFSAVYSGNPEGVDVALDFLTSHYREITAYYKGLNTLRSLVNGLANRFTNKNQISQLSLFTLYPDLDPEFKAVAQQALESATANLEWTTSFETQLSEYFGLDNNSASPLNIGFGLLLSAILILFH